MVQILAESVRVLDPFHDGDCWYGGLVVHASLLHGLADRRGGWCADLRFGLDQGHVARFVGAKDGLEDGGLKRGLGGN